MKLLGSEENIRNFRDLKNTVQRKIRNNYNTYIENGIDPNLDKGNKRLWGMVKRLKRDSSGVAPLKSGGKLMTDPLDKANALNSQFKSVFNSATPTEPPDMGPSPFVPMPTFDISIPGVLKLLKNLKIHKAPGPDGIVPRILRDFADQHAPPLMVWSHCHALR
jgi:hypothetical protein